MNRSAKSINDCDDEAEEELEVLVDAISVYWRPEA